MSNTSMNTEYGQHRLLNGDLQNLREYLNSGATGVTPEILSSYTNLVYKNSTGASAVENMVAGNPIVALTGDICSTGGTLWERVSTSVPAVIQDFKPLTIANVRDFGAVGDGVTDDNAAIQEAINIAGAVRLSGNHFQGSVLTISDPFVKIYGEGLYGFSGDKQILFNGNNLDIELDGFYHSCTQDTIGLYIGDQVNTVVDKLVCNNLKLSNAKRAIDVNCQANNVMVKNCTITDIGNLSTPSCSAIQIGNQAATVKSENVSIIGNTIRNVYGSGSTEVHAIIVTADDVLIKNNVISDIGNQSDGNGAEAIYTKSERVNITNNNIVNGGNGQGAITLKGFAPGSGTESGGYHSITGNKIAFNTNAISSYSIGLGLFGYEVIASENTIDGALTSAIYCSGNRGNVTISSNSLTNCSAQTALRVDTVGAGARSYHISDNRMDLKITDANYLGTMQTVFFNIADDLRNVSIVNNSLRYQSSSSSIVGTLIPFSLSTDPLETIDMVDISGNSIDIPISSRVTNTKFCSIGESSTVPITNITVNDNKTNRQNTDQVGVGYSSTIDWTTYNETGNSWNYVSAIGTSSAFSKVKGVRYHNRIATNTGDTLTWLTTTTGKPGTTIEAATVA